jgi:PAS domain S-box-containing protein
MFNLTAKAMRNKCSTCHRASAWYRSLSFASTRADFYDPSLSHAPALSWSESYSYTSPEADFTFISVSDLPSTAMRWSDTISFATPESDFSASKDERSVEWEWSGNFSFASPESDFQGAEITHDNAEAEWSGQLTFASPESDFQVAAIHSQHAHEWSNILSFATPESDFQASNYVSPHTLLSTLVEDAPSMALQTDKLSNLDSVRQNALWPLPRTLQEALGSNDPRAIVVTEAHRPFHIVDVNDAWVGLCGYSREEARNQSLAILQGPDTNVKALTEMVESLMTFQTETATQVVNYTKEGRKFWNSLRAGPLYDEDGNITHFVGILQEVMPNSNELRMSYA